MRVLTDERVLGECVSARVQCPQRRRGGIGSSGSRSGSHAAQDHRLHLPPRRLKGFAPLLLLFVMADTVMTRGNYDIVRLRVFVCGGGEGGKEGEGRKNK